MHKCRKKFKGGNLRRPSNETTFDRPAATPPRSAGMDQAGQTPPDETPSAVKAARSWLSGIVDNTQILSPTDSTPGGTAPAPAASAPAAAPTAAGPGLIRRLTSGLTSRTLLGGGNTDEKDKDNADKENALAKDEEEHPTQEPKWLQRAYSSMVDGHHTGAVPEDEPEPYRPSGRRASGVAQQNAEDDGLDEPSWLGQADKAVHPVAPVAPVAARLALAPPPPAVSAQYPGLVGGFPTVRSLPALDVSWPSNQRSGPHCSLDSVLGRARPRPKPAPVGAQL